MKRIKELAKNILLILAIILIFKSIISYELAKTEYKTYNYEIRQNETLWSIASKICQKDNNLYIRKVINDIKEINDLSTSTIYQGQVLRIPIYN